MRLVLLLVELIGGRALANFGTPNLFHNLLNNALGWRLLLSLEIDQLILTVIIYSIALHVGIFVCHPALRASLKVNLFGAEVNTDLRIFLGCGLVPSLLRLLALILEAPLTLVEVRLALTVQAPIKQGYVLCVLLLLLRLVIVVVEPGLKLHLHLHLGAVVNVTRHYRVTS